MMRRADGDERLYHDPYRWSSKPRRADKILDTPGPRPSAHTASLESQDT
jgi:hypothetical protein